MLKKYCVEVVCGIQSDWGEKMASRVVFLTNAPKSSLDCPSANRIPGFFDLLTRQQDYLSYSACPLHLHCLCHLLAAQPVGLSSPPMLLDPDASRLRVSCGSMWVLLLFIFVR